MAIQEITKPPMLDETGQDMVTKLQAIANSINTNAGQINYSNTSSQLQATKVQTAIDEVKGITDTISSNLAQLVKTESITSSSITVANNDRGVFTIDVSKTGYTPIGIGVVTFSNNYVFLGAFNLSGNSATIVCHNRTGSSSTLTVTITVMYIKS